MRTSVQYSYLDSRHRNSSPDHPDSFVVCPECRKQWRESAMIESEYIESPVCPECEAWLEENHEVNHSCS